MSVEPPTMSDKAGTSMKAGTSTKASTSMKAAMSMSAALTRYRVMAYVVGVGLAVLVFVGIPLQIAGHNQVVAIVGPIHGFFYIIYLIVALDLARRARFSFLEMLAMVGAGLLPILAFVVEHYVTKRVRQDMAAGVPERKFFLARTVSKEPPT